MKQSAAIKRATQQARNGMRELDRQSVEQLILLYERSAEDVRRQIYAAADAGDRVPQYRLQQLLAQIETVIDRLGEQRDAMLREAIGAAADLGVRPYTVQGALAVGASTPAVLESAAAQRVSEAAVDFVVNFSQADGVNLSERVWRLNEGAKEALRRAIAGAVIRGESAARAAQDLALRGQSVPGTMQQLDLARTGHLLKLADILTSRDGGELWKAERVFRTEMNRAHGEAFMAGAERTPGFAGLRFLLSPMHPKPDICDLLARQNLHGLGPGVYPTRELTPWPAHPNTLSFLEIVFADEISDADRAGKETELQALQRLAPEIREGVLGQGKAQYFDRGLLTKGMIRAPLRAVEERLQRQGYI